MAPLIRVAAVDDHPLILEGFRGWISRADGFEYAGAYDTVEKCLQVRPLPDAVILDIHLADGSLPSNNVRALKRAEVAVIVVSGDEEQISVIGAIEAGADGYLRKGDDLPMLAIAVRETIAGRHTLSTELAFILSRDTRADRPHLTDRERQVLDYFGSGLPWERVAARLGIANGTVKVHLRNIRGKYNRPPQG